MSPRNCCSALSPPAGSMGRINGKDCFQQNQWLTDGFRSGHHQPEGRWPREGVWAQEWEGRPTSRGSLNPLTRPQAETQSEGARPSPSAPLGLNMTRCGQCLGPSENMKAFSDWRGAEPSGLSTADTQSITLWARAIRDAYPGKEMRGSRGRRTKSLQGCHGAEGQTCP